MVSPDAAPRRRTGWPDLPVAVRRAVSAAVGAPVVSAQSPPGGHTPGVAARLLLADGRRCFAKAASAAHGEWVQAAYRHEAAVNAHLPPSVPAPRMWTHLDDGDWVCLLFDDVPGRFPSPSWEDADLARVLDAVDRSARALTPNPVPGAAPVRDAFAGVLGHAWEALRGHPALPDVDPWAAGHLADLLAREPHWADGVDGDGDGDGDGGTLLHLDLRRDNVLLTPTDVVFVDWAWPAVGAPWLDLVCLLPTMAVSDDRHDAEALFLSRAAGRAAPPAAVDAFLVALAGYWRAGSLLPAPAYAPGLREEQRRAADGATRWLRARASRWAAP